MEKLNNKNSPVLQALLDLQAQGVYIDIDGINPQQLQKADEVFNKHQYPDRRIVYSKVYNARCSKAKYSLDMYERLILDVLIDFMSKENLVSIKFTDLAEFTGISERKTRYALKSLREQGFIAIHTPSKKNCPTVYMINPQVATAGKPIQEDSFKKIAGDDALELYKGLNEKTLQGISISTVKTDTFANYNLVEHDMSKTIMCEILKDEEDV